MVLGCLMVICVDRDVPMDGVEYHDEGYEGGIYCAADSDASHYANWNEVTRACCVAVLS